MKTEGLRVVEDPDMELSKGPYLYDTVHDIVEDLKRINNRL